MADLDHIWGQDIAVSPSGDLALVDGRQLGIERLIRRYMTAADRVDAFQVAQPGEYIFHPKYGGSVPQRIGDIGDLNLLRSVFRRETFKERTVARVPQPQVTLTQQLGAVTVSVKYADANTGQQTFFSFDASK